MTSPAPSPPERRPPVVIHDRRRIDPDPLQPRVPPTERDPRPVTALEAGAPDSLQAVLAERTADLQYRERADRVTPFVPTWYRTGGSRTMTSAAPTRSVLRQVGFELRAHAKAVPRLWHIAPTGDELALCGKHLPDPASTRPISYADAVPANQHCAVCWPSYKSPRT